MIKSLSIIIPFFNEQKRIGGSLIKIKQFIKNNYKINYEIIFVDDGSTDNSGKKILDFKKNTKFLRSKIKLLNLKKNTGKGAALKLGVLKAKKEWVLTTDIDLSVSLKQIIIWQKKGYIKKNNKDTYFGSRGLKDSVVKTRFYRKFLGLFFKIFYNFFLSIDLKDTQCGFKLYKKNIAKKIFTKMKSSKFEHDLELVLLAKKINSSVIELPVEWKHKAGSKLHIFFDPIKMFFGIVKIWWSYRF